MRRILVDAARARGRAKRGGDAIQVSLSDVLGVALPATQDLVALDDALKTLETLDSRQSQVVELRFFGGLSLEEIAEALQVSVGTVRRDWSLAQAWLYRELSGAPSVMTPERHRRVGELYHAALAMAEEERTTFLEHRCGGDADLLREVQSLLTAHRQAGNFIAAPALAHNAPRWPPVPRGRSGNASRTTKCSPRLAWAAWARCIGHATGNSGAMSRSKSSRVSSRPIPSGAFASSARRGCWPL